METDANRALGVKASMTQSTARALGSKVTGVASAIAGEWHRQIWHVAEPLDSSAHPPSSVQCANPKTNAANRTRAVSWIRGERIAGKLREALSSCKRNCCATN